MNTWQGDKSEREMRADQTRILKSQGFTQDGDVWRGKHYDARPTDRPGLRDSNGMFNMLAIEYFEKGGGA